LQKTQRHEALASHLLLTALFISQLQPSQLGEQADEEAGFLSFQKLGWQTNQIIAPLRRQLAVESVSGHILAGNVCVAQPGLRTDPYCANFFDLYGQRTIT
jgi:hypothetical protein